MKTTKYQGPPFTYPGTKTRALSRLIPILTSIPHNRFVDVFGGAGTVTLNMPPNYGDVFNDVDGRIVGFFKTLLDDDKRTKFKEYLSFAPIAKGLFETLRDFETSEDDVKRAVGFFWFQCANQFGTKRREVNQIRDLDFKGKKKIASTIERLDSIVDHFRRVEIVSQDFRKLIAKTDDEQTLFYCDPPYVGTDAGYETAFTQADFDELTKYATTKRGKFVVSSFENPSLDILRNAGFRELSFERRIGFNAKSKDKTRVEKLLLSPNCEYEESKAARLFGDKTK